MPKSVLDNADNLEMECVRQAAASPNTVHLTILTDAEKLMRRVRPRLRGRSV